MKKIFTLIALCAGLMTASATDYKGKLMVILDGNPMPSQESVINVIEEGGKYTLSLNDFTLGEGESAIPVGNIVLSNVEPNLEDKLPEGAVLLETEQKIAIAPGSNPEIGWLGPILGDVPVKLEAAMIPGILHADIDIPFGAMQIKVLFDNRQFQLSNSDFENFHKASVGEGDKKVESDEPNGWHSFMTSTGALASIVSTVPHTFISDDVRPGTTGKNSVLIKSGKVLGFVVANGTLTTGRLMAGSISATDPKNNAFMDLTSEDKDPNGDPFYTRLAAMPDSIYTWVKFKQGEGAPAEYPYATITAAITDGSYYQEPVDKNYDDVILGYASNKQIAATGEWQKLEIPFDYETYDKGDDDMRMPQAILVTISTNAIPSQATGDDELYVDDFQLVYSCLLKNIYINGVALPDFDKNVHEYEYNVGSGAMPTADEFLDMVDYDELGAEVNSVVTFDAVTNTAKILIVSADLTSTSTYNVAFINGTGIKNIVGGGNNVSKEIYNLNGQKVKSMKKGDIYVVKYADGKTVKFIKK